ncbi:MAG: VOC family protein [Lentimicrobiaceae bacterium]|jgi:predicted 3-demethylubiquinone-9 3-methyltransferase (glyoxalase superfamily)
MNNPIYPCLWFDGNAKAAAEFYCSVFRNSKIVDDNPMVVNFELNGNLIMALNGGPMFKFNPSISMFVHCESHSETNLVWDKLIKGGKELMPIDKYPWSERYGWLEDKFGFTWQISVAATEEAKFKITPSMLFTGKQFGRAEEAITFYSSVFENSATGLLLHYEENDPNEGKVLYSEFNLNHYSIIAMDGPGVHEFTFNEAFSFTVSCQSQEEIDYYWNKLTENGGSEGQCGWLKDKFGVSWQIVPAILGTLMSDPVKSERVVNAFMQMKKFDIEKLVNA